MDRRTLDKMSSLQKGDVCYNHVRIYLCRSLDLTYKVLVVERAVGVAIVNRAQKLPHVRSEPAPDALKGTCRYQSCEQHWLCLCEGTFKKREKLCGIPAQRKE